MSDPKSAISSNEYAFPRGGSTALTPMEVKEISNEATRDVLFEVANNLNKKRSKPDANPSTVSRKKQKKNSKKGSKNGDDDNDDVESDEKKTAVEYLTFKNLLPGSLVFGQIQYVNKLDLVLALENNLVGYVPITSISTAITNAIDKFEEESEEEESEEEESEDEESEDEEKEDDEKNDKSKIHATTFSAKEKKLFPDLKSMFQVGSWLKAKVVESDNSQKKRRIELSLEPKLVNANIEDEDLIPGNVILCAVKSVEDHGVILDTGFEKFSAFMSNKELKNAGLEPASLQEGLVLSCVLVSQPSGRIITVKPVSLAAGKKPAVVSTITSVDSIQPGILVNALVSDITSEGIITRVFGLVDGTISIAQIQNFNTADLKHKYAIGSTIKTRILAILEKEGTKKLLLSMLPTTMSLDNHQKQNQEALEAYPIGFIFDEVEVLGLDKSYVYVNFGSKSLFGQIHNSNLGGDKSLLNYSVGSKHKARVLGFNTVDNLLVLTFDDKIINAEYLNVRDIPLGAFLPNCEVVKVLPDNGGLSVKINDEFMGLVPFNQMSDIKLVYPERKFRAGSKVKGRLLTHRGKTPLITLRKTLVNLEDDEIILQFEDAKVGFKTNATVEKFIHGGAIVSFFGSLRAFLPKTEISETFVDDASKFLKLGQIVKVKILDIKEDQKRVVVTMKQSSELSDAQKTEISQLLSGRSIINAIVVEKKNNAVLIELEGSNLRGVINDGQLSDGNYEQNRAMFKKLEISSKIRALVLEKDLKARTIIATAKKSMIEAAEKNALPIDFDDIQPNKVVKGYVKSVTNLGLFVSFTGRLTGLVLAKYATANANEDLSKKFHKYQSLTCRVLSVDTDNKRFLLALLNSTNDSGDEDDKVVNPVDTEKSVVADYSPGVHTKAVVKSIKGTQLNVQLADNLQGRVDITQCFKSINDIKNVRQPLSGFSKGDVVDVKVIGVHDARNHTFLPITNRKAGKQTILELSIVDRELNGKNLSSLKLDDITLEQELLCFVNNIDRGFVWVSISPSVRGRISFMDLTNDGSVFQGFENKYPIGTAIQAKVKNIDQEHKSLSLISRDNHVSKVEDVQIGQTYPARIVKVKDSYVLVDLGDKVIASSFITDALNDYSDKLAHVFHLNEYVAAKVLDIDVENNKIAVMLRNEESSAAASDKTINSVDDLSRGQVVKGFVKNIASNGVYVSLGRCVHALVRVSDLSDSYLKDWKKFFKPAQSVIGKIINCKEQGKVLMTLKESEVNGDLKILKNYDDLVVGEVFEGTVTKVTDFGVFVKLDGTINISGLCHHSEISENDVSNIASLFGEGDRVKVKILKVDLGKKQLSLGMKASYFADEAEQKEEDDDEDVDMSEALEDEQSEAEEEEQDDDEEEEDEEEEVIDAETMDVDSDSDSDVESGDEETEAVSSLGTGLSTNGFDWTASILDQNKDVDDSSDDDDDDDNENDNGNTSGDISGAKKRSKRNKNKASKHVVDKTIDLNTRAPQSTADFERLLIGNPNSSILWMNYMSFNLQLSEVDKAREIGERALETINYREEQEKLNIWIAMLNLENTFGSEESLEKVFKRSCQYMDSFVMHQKLVNIYIMSEKYDAAQDLFKVMVKKFGKEHVSTWVLYASFLLDQEEQLTKVHELLSRALQALPKRDHIEVVRKFAQLEFAKGDAEQARSLFEGLIADAPKRIDLWNVYIDQEIKLHDKDEGEDNVLNIRDLFERVIENKKISRKQAKFFFNKWLKFEEGLGDEKMVAKVKAKAIEYVQSQEA